MKVNETANIHLGRKRQLSPLHNVSFIKANDHDHRVEWRSHHAKGLICTQALTENNKKKQTSRQPDKHYHYVNLPCFFI